MLDRLRRMLGQPGFAVLLVLLGLLAFNWPFPEPARRAGDFALFLYFFGLWGGAVLIAFVLADVVDDSKGDGDDV
ncbi:MAG: hypothetical protein HYU74_12100 [Dechloromonas sp.]|nr:hypothetical protein [Dechloromonas sp.]